MQQSKLSLPGTPANVLLQHQQNQQNFQQLLSCLDIEDTTILALLSAAQENVSSASSAASTPFLSLTDKTNGLVLFKSIRQRHKIDPAVQQLQGSSNKFWSPNCFKVVKSNIYRVRVCFAQHFFDSHIGHPALLSRIELLDKDLQPIDQPNVVERLNSVRNYIDQQLTCKAEHVLLDYCLKLNVVSTKSKGPFTLRFTYFSEQYHQQWQIPSVSFDIAARLKNQDKSRRGTRSNKLNTTSSPTNSEAGSSVFSSTNTRKRSRDSNAPDQQVSSSATASPILNEEIGEVNLESYTPQSTTSASPLYDQDIHSFLSQLGLDNDSNNHVVDNQSNPLAKRQKQDPLQTQATTNAVTDFEYLEQLGFNFETL